MVGAAARIGRVAGVLVILGASLGYMAASDPGEPETWTKTSFQEFITIEPGGTLRVVNFHGNVYARFGGYENRAELLGVVQRLEPELPELELKITPVDNDVLISVGCTAEGPKACSAATPTTRADRIDLVVFVPLGVRLDARTHADLIAAKGVRSDLVASSVKGDIRLKSVKGRVQAKSDRGSITAALVSGVSTAEQSFTTSTGDIEVWLGEDANADVHIATSGEISTDFSLEIEHRRFEEPGKHARAVIGNGGPKIRLHTKRGRVQLFRQQLNFRPEPQQGSGS